MSPCQKNPGRKSISKENGTSSFTYNFNSAYFPAPVSGGADGLAIRVMDTQPGGLGAGIAVVRRIGGNESMTFEHVSGGPSQLVLGCSKPPTPSAPCADDPRMAYSPGTNTYWLTYDNTSGLDKSMSGRVTWIASSQTPWVPASWTFHGPVAPFKLTAGVSLLIRDDVPDSLHYAFIGNVNTAGSLYYATSPDLVNWTLNHSAWQRGRPDHFDHNGIAAGPQAERLSDGNYLYLYNIDNARNCQSASCGPCGVNCSANTGCPFCRDGRCALGWMILDKDDPTKVVARAEEALLFAELEFETTGSAAFPTQTPWVIFTDGLQKVAEDEFIVWYGAGDTNTGAARIKVTVPTTTNASSP